MKTVGNTAADLPRRGSLRSRAAASVSMLTLRQIGALLPFEQAWGLWLSRQIVAGIMRAFGPPLTGVRVEAIADTAPGGHRVGGEWVRGPGADRTDAAIYFLHGSGYALCSPETHRPLASWLSKLTGLPVFCVDYRLAPLHRFPAAADDVRAGWDWLLRRYGLPPHRIVVAGDSAGGHLAVDLMLQPDVAARRAASLVLLSPLFDVTFGLATERERVRPDPAMRAADAARLLRLYCGDIDPTHPRLALDVIGGPVLPPTLIQAGGAEILVADAHRLATDIRQTGSPCELQVWPDQAHVFQAVPLLAPEATEAMRHVARFIRESLSSHDV